MRWSIVISCLVIGGCSGASGTPDPQPSLSPAADPTAPEDTGVASEGDDAVAASPDSEAPDSEMSADSDTTTEPTDSGVADSSAPKPPADSGVAADAHLSADTHVADTHVPHTDAHVPTDSRVAPDTYVAPTDTGAAIDTAPADTGSSVTPTYVSHEVTFYGWPDNDPPGPAIAYPKIHSSAGGTGTYADPITFATAAAEFPAGTILYVPFIKKYVIMEDYCAACTSDWSSGKRHIDIWMNSDNNNGSQLLACQYSWTRSAADVEIHPPPDRPVTTAPLFDTSTAICRTSP
ncbi:MAG: hypothetical protein ACXWP4_26750 [Polyangiales bacterium]